MNTATLSQELAIKLVEKTELEDKSINAIFEIEPLERGFGITMGNTLRRICLSHLEGTAVTSVKILGAGHEFTTMKGVLEDTVEVILNCKSLVFKTELTEEFTLKATVKGPGEVKASDLEVPAGVELINPDILLATVTEKMDFSIEVTANRGVGYVLADEHDTQGKSVDVIHVDSAYMPIKKFSYSVEPIRVGESSEASSRKHEKLIVELISNGAIEPEKALSMSGKLLLQKLTPLMNLTGESLPVFSAAAPAAQEEEETTEDFSDVGIETLNLSVRSYNCLKRANKNNLKDLLQMTTEELMSIKNFGKKSAEEVIRILNEKGHYLTDDPRRTDANAPAPEASNPNASYSGGLY